MANADFSAMFKIYPCRNPELASVSKTCYEFGKTISAEPSAALSSGLDVHAIKRQRDYLIYATALVNALHAKPTPDLPATHPTGYAVNLSKQYDTFVEDINGEKVPLNEQTNLIAVYWMVTAVELVASQSSALAGSLLDYDHARAINNLAALEKLVTEMTTRPVLDLPETAQPGAEMGSSGTGKK